MKQNNNSRGFRRLNVIDKSINCSCGSKAKLKTNKNYPFGKKSKPRTFKYYKCTNCGKIKILD